MAMVLQTNYPSNSFSEPIQNFVPKQNICPMYYQVHYNLYPTSNFHHKYGNLENYHLVNLLFVRGDYVLIIQLHIISTNISVRPCAEYHVYLIVVLV